MKLKKFSSIAVCFVALVVVNGCGSDAHVEVTEERVPTPPVRPHTPIVVPPPPAPPGNPPYAQAPAFGQPRPLVRYTPTNPVVPRGPEPRANFVTKEMTTNRVLERRDFGKDDFRGCLLVSPARNLSNPPRKSLWLVQFEGPANNVRQSRTKLFIQLFENAGANIDSRLSRNGRIEFLQTTNHRVFVFSRLAINTGGEATNRTQRTRLFSNRVDRNNVSVFSTCAISLRKNGNQLNGRFNCDRLANDKGQWVKAEGSFRCPLISSTNYPALLRKERVAR